MEIEPNEPENYSAPTNFLGRLRDTRVTFENFSEWETFASALPFLHPQHFRLTVTKIRQRSPYPAPIRSYHPESFPRTIALNATTLGAVLGELSLYEQSEITAPRQLSDRMVERGLRQKEIATTIAEYFGAVRDRWLEADI